MGNLVEMGYLAEMACGKNFSYILQDQTLFSNMDYKVLQSNGDASFIKCMKLHHNGNLQLFYITSGYRPLSSLIAALDADGFVSVAANIFQSVYEVKNNGFLKCENIDISLEHIYIDSATQKAYLLYLPLTKGMYTDEAYFENELRSTFAKLILGLPALSSAKTMQLFANLQNAAIPLEGVFENVLHEKTTPPKPSEDPIVLDRERPREVRFISINTSEKISLLMDKDEYVIGRSIKHADGVIRDNKMVGRAHCRVSVRPDGYDVQDLDSANGTYINQVRVPSGGHAKLKNGDILRLANIELKVLIK